MSVETQTVVNMESPDDIALADKMNAARGQIITELKKLIVGQDETVNLILLSLFVGGNSLIVGVPGLAKTLLIRTLAQVLDLKFNRIQFTPDLMPSDITGTHVFQPAEGTFRFMPGPVFANILLADEINRASPKTQSALLEAMEERQVTIEGVTTPLPRPFLVIATQNPVEHEGTFPLPESQLDRFLIRVSIGYPDHTTESELVTGDVRRTVQPAVSPDELRAMIEAVSDVRVTPELVRYIVDIADASRRHPGLRLGMSPRATIQLGRAARALAAGRGRNYATPDDVKALAVPVLAHRLVARPETSRTGNTERIVREILDSVPVPPIR